MLTIKEIENSNKTFLIPKDIAEFMGMNPTSIRSQAKKDPKLLGFPVTITGSRVRIPKDAFVKWYKGEMVSNDAVVS